MTSDDTDLASEGRNIAILSLGGTIASTPHPERGGVIPTMSAADLAAAVPHLASVASFRAEAIVSKPSTELTFSEIGSLCKHASDLVNEGAFDGVVITQGTDTMEETSFVADLMWSDAAPLVFTGAMRNPGSAGADGPANLLAAARVAASICARDQGVLVVMNDEIHAARFVKKLHVSSPSAFSSNPDGPVGFVSEDRVVISAKRGRLFSFPCPDSWNTDVELVTSTLNGSLRMLESLTRMTPAGAVIAGFGGGHTRAQDVSLVEMLAANVPVVLASRTGSGRVLEDTYGFPGSEIDLLGRGLISAGSLNPLKARILLTLLISLGWSRDIIESTFRDYVNWKLIGIESDTPRVKERVE